MHRSTPLEAEKSSSDAHPVSSTQDLCHFSLGNGLVATPRCLQAAEDVSFKPTGGQIGENDMDYDTDLRSMAALRRRLRNAQDNYSRYKT